jgi:hypothetical protein
LKSEREARLEEVGFIWNGQSHSEAVVEDSDNDNDLDRAKGSSKNGESRRPVKLQLSTMTMRQRKPPTTAKVSRLAWTLAITSKVGTRLSVLWGDGCYYGGVVTKMKNQDNKRICYVEYYDGENAWHILENEKYFIVYSVGTKVYKNFPGHGFYWGEVTVSKHDKDGFCYQVEYSDGSLETITVEPDSAQQLEELHLAFLDANRMQSKRK